MTRLSKESRTAKSIKNSTVALSFFIIDFILKFFSRSIFLKILGDELLGLNTTMMNLLQFLNLAELGIGAAVGFTLYKPISDKDTDTINEILQLNGHLYKRVALLAGSGALILMCFFPIIFKKTALPLWYPYATFITFLLGLILNYCINYKQILLSASQMDYKIQYSYKSYQIFKVVIQIIVVELLPMPYIWWLIIEGSFSVISTIALDSIIKRTFPYLNKTNSPYKFLRTKYNNIIIKIKQVFYHKICGYVLTQTSPLIIYAYMSLSAVTLYTNYQIIVIGITQFFNAVFNSMTNAIGNLVAENCKELIIKTFYEIFSIRFYIASVCCVSLLGFSTSFISIWLGQEYILANSTLYIIIAILFISLTRTTVDAFINAYGLFQDIFAPIIEASINLGTAILLGYYWGLNGILCGTLVSFILIVFLWKPVFLFKRGFKLSISGYITNYIKHILVLIISYIIWNLLWHPISQVFNVVDIVSFLGFFVIGISIFITILTCLMIICKLPIIASLKRFHK